MRVVAVGVADRRPSAGRRGFSQAYAAFVAEFDLRKLAIDPGEVFGSVRVREEGREIPL